MYINFAKLFHRAAKDSSDGGRVRIPKDSSEWPQEWKTTNYKSYGSLPNIALPESSANSACTSLIAARHSRNIFTAQPMSLDEVSTILKYSCGEMSPDKYGKIRRSQPSGGARYPIETYILVFQGSDALPAGTYHYDVQNHTLDILGQRQCSNEDIEKLFSYEWVKQASMAVVLTGIASRTTIKYGQRGYRYLLLEAGHIGQNIYLTSHELGIGCSAMGGSKDEAIEALLGIDGEDESLVYTLILGK
jgi:SagB-type dehydrogenase family enzyme